MTNDEYWLAFENRPANLPHNAWLCHFFEAQGPYEGAWILLLTPEEFGHLPHGTEVISISGHVKLVGIDLIHMDDTRGGYLPVGTLDE